VSLHGTKEYSGVDISKKIGDAAIGIQVKSINDDISEDKVRAQTSKALEYNFDGFVWIYGRPSSNEVTTSIQAAYHYFARINDAKKMYCTLIHPELLAELFRKYAINLE
jgi:peptidoglycan/xylan/chitin deacetylase (PgdA/CDA1 family)